MQGEIGYEPLSLSHGQRTVNAVTAPLTTQQGPIAQVTQPSGTVAFAILAGSQEERTPTQRRVAVRVVHSDEVLDGHGVIDVTSGFCAQRERNSRLRHKVH